MKYWYINCATVWLDSLSGGGAVFDEPTSQKDVLFTARLFDPVEQI